MIIASYSRISKTPSGSHRTYGSSQPYNNAGARRFTRPPRITPLETTCKHSYDCGSQIAHRNDPTFEAKPLNEKPKPCRYYKEILITCMNVSILTTPTARASSNEGPIPLIKTSASGVQGAELDRSRIDAPQQSSKDCELSTSLTALAAGFIGTELHCPGVFFWSAEPGIVFYGFDQPDAYFESSVGIDYPTTQTSRLGIGESVWSIRTTIAYVYVRPSSFESLPEAQPSSGFLSPGLQQWAMLANSKISSEFQLTMKPSSQVLKYLGIQLWQTLPPLWRSFGALRNTRKAQLSGFNLSGHGSYGDWHASVGLGVSSVAIERTVLSFVHPIVELKYRLGSY